MIYVLNIGHDSYAFQNARGLQTVIETLAKARELKHHYWPGCEREHPEHLDLCDRPVEISMHCVQGVSFIKGTSKREVIDPEVMPHQREGEGDAAFAMRAIKAGSRKAVSSQLRLMLGEGK